MAHSTELSIISSIDVETGQVPLDGDVALYSCASCDAELSDRYHLDCPRCGARGCPVSRCRGCGATLGPRVYQFVSLGPAQARVVKQLTGVCCTACGVSGIEGHELDLLAELAASSELAGLAGPLEIIPEMGYFTPQRLEVLADADVGGVDEPEHVEKRADGMVLRISGPSALFEAALAAITDHDPGDIFSPTLTLTPGPPYGREQRATFHRLLAEVQRQLGSAVTCWSASVGLSEEPLVDPVLAEQLIGRSGDRDGEALALYNAILAGHAPGRLLNGIRLLERVLDDPAPARFAETLRAAVEQRGRRPLPVLEQLWRAINPGRAFDEQRVYGAMQEFHARCALPPADERGAPLPWEQPDHEGYAAWLRRLVSELL
jgi:hypothetical protein